MLVAVIGFVTYLNLRSYTHWCYFEDNLTDKGRFECINTKIVSKDEYSIKNIGQCYDNFDDMPQCFESEHMYFFKFPLEKLKEGDDGYVCMAYSMEFYNDDAKMSMIGIESIPTREELYEKLKRC